MDVGQALVVCFLMGSMTAVRSQMQKGPTNALKRAGDSVTLECVTENKNCDLVDWAKVEGLQSPKLVYRNGQGMLNNDNYPTTRYNVSSTGGCSLTITQLVIGDSGRFMCTKAVGDKEETRSAILIVINMVTGSCVSNSNALDKGDGYSLWCAINVPAKSVEPSNVALVLPPEAGEINTTTNGTQPQTVETTLTGIATKENITQRLCRASFTPKKEPNYDDTAATLNVCPTTKLIVSYPVENVTVSPPSGPYYKGIIVHCIANGHPPPTFSWANFQSGKVVKNGSTLEIQDDVGNKYICTAMNMFKGNVVYQSIIAPIEVSSAPEEGNVVVIVICCCCGAVLVGTLVGGVIVWNVESCPGHDRLHSLFESVTDRNNHERASVPLTNSAPSAPDKPPRVVSEHSVKPVAL